MLTLAASLIGVTALVFVAKGYVLGQVLTVVFAVFFFLLRALGNASLPLSTVSIATSFLASYLTLMRSPAYAANDGVLIALWVIAALESPGCAPMIVCFAMFLLNDCYGFVNWRRMMRSQQ